MSANPTPRETVRIDLAERSYDIHIGRGVMSDPALLSKLPAATQAVIVTNTTVGPLYARQLADSVRSRYRIDRIIELPDGEQFKDWKTLDLIFDGLLQAGCDRKTVVFALGGGVVGDMAGFAASAYMRGVPFVQVPTTLLSQVDSSVGGKTAINHPLGKNMIGSFYQPALVLADMDTLRTLPEREMVAGLAEVIKYGPIADASFFDWIEAHLEKLLGKDEDALMHAIRRSCEIKAQVVGLDEREGGLRAILNFGHTFGHAIESGLGFGKWLHGEAVGCGMVMAADLSCRMGLMTDADRRRLVHLIERAGLPVRGPRLGPQRYLDIMRLDKKSEAGQIRFVLVNGIGQAVMREAPDATVTETIESCTA